MHGWLQHAIRDADRGPHWQVPLGIPQTLFVFFVYIFLLLSSFFGPNTLEDQCPPVQHPNERPYGAARTSSGHDEDPDVPHRNAYDLPRGSPHRAAYTFPIARFELACQLVPDTLPQVHGTNEFHSRLDYAYINDVASNILHASQPRR